MTLNLRRGKGFEYVNSIDPSVEWRSDFPWQLLRLRSIVLGIILQSSVAIFSFIKGWPAEASILLGVIAAIVSFSLFWLRLVRIRRINSDEAIHRLTHDIRDRLFEIASAPDDKIRRVRLEQFFQELAQNVASYFRERSGNDSFNCVLRIASFRNGSRVYHTVARSKGLADERGLRSQSERADEGIAKRLLEHNSQGAYLIRDRMEAARNDIWKLSPNDTLDDVKTVLSLPVNGWFNSKFDMLGILHLTSRTGTIRRADWLPTKALSDLLGHVLSVVYASPQGNESPIDNIVGMEGIDE